MEEKIYALMAQAEDMQAHAEKLQKGADKTFAGLPLAVEQAGQKIRSTGLLGALKRVLRCRLLLGWVSGLVVRVGTPPMQIIKN